MSTTVPGEPSGSVVRVGDEYIVDRRVARVTRIVEPVRCYVEPVRVTRHPYPPVIPLALLVGPWAVHPLRKRAGDD